MISQKTYRPDDTILGISWCRVRYLQIVKASVFSGFTRSDNWKWWSHESKIS